MNPICRVCALEASKTTRLDAIHDGLPVSVIVMIICPIKVDPSDNLPQKICENCLEIVISAFQLRDESLKSDRYLREHGYEPELDKDIFAEIFEETEGESFIKQEPLFEENTNIYIEEFGKHEKNERQDEKQKDKKGDFKKTKGNYIDCSKALKKGASVVWRYIGSLCNKYGEVLDLEYFYCVKCYKKFKRLSSQNGTSYYWKHLKTAHNILQDTTNKKKPSTLFFSSSSSTSSSSSPSPVDVTKEIYTCDYCSKGFNTKQKIEIHMQTAHMKHNYLNDRSGFRVLCKQDSTESLSLTSSYFGTLVNSDGTDVKNRREFYHCKICVEEKNLLSLKFDRSSSISTLKRHLLKYHPFVFLQIQNETTENSAMNEDDQSGNESYTSEKLLFAQNEQKKFNSHGLGVDCYKANHSPSLAWKYFGKLIDSSGRTVTDESNYFFCKICVSRGLTSKYSGKISTSTLFAHLKSVHGIEYPRHKDIKS